MRSARRACPDALTSVARSLDLFVLGGYLAMAGHRSHLYQSNNQLIAYRRSKQFATEPDKEANA